jgi:hypothetical protein
VLIALTPLLSEEAGGLQAIATASVEAHTRAVLREPIFQKFFA